MKSSVIVTRSLAEVSSPKVAHLAESRLAIEAAVSELLVRDDPEAPATMGSASQSGATSKSGAFSISLAIRIGTARDTQRNSAFSGAMFRGRRTIRTGDVGPLGAAALVCFRNRHAG